MSWRSILLVAACIALGFVLGRVTPVVPDAEAQVMQPAKKQERKIYKKPDGPVEMKPAQPRTPNLASLKCPNGWYATSIKEDQYKWLYYCKSRVQIKCQDPFHYVEGIRVVDFGFPEYTCWLQKE